MMSPVSGKYKNKDDLEAFMYDFFLKLKSHDLYKQNTKRKKKSMNSYEAVSEINLEN